MSTALDQVTLIKVPMAGTGVIQAPGELETLLGSCVGVAIWDRSSKIAALAHVVLPESNGATKTPGKFADTAIAELKRMMVAEGAMALSLTAKIAGGAAMFGKAKDTDIGSRNRDAVIEQLQQHKIRVLGEHCGGSKGRIIRFKASDFSISVRIGRDIVTVL